MNTLIYKLADQAHKESYVVYLQRQEAEGPANVIFYDIFNEKFAELIVRECCQKLENDGMVEVAMEMKQHFGVEE